MAWGDARAVDREGQNVGKIRAERGAKARRKLLANLTYRDDGSCGIGDPRKGLDCVSDLAAAVQFAFTALESLGNHTIDQLEPDSKVEVERDGRTVALDRDQMERNLSVSEKLAVAIPAFTGQPSLKGNALWSKSSTSVVFGSACSIPRTADTTR